MTKDVLQPCVTIAISTRNRPAVLARSIRKTRQAGANLPLVVYDDASDNFTDVLDAVKEFDDCAVLRGVQRSGPGVGRNAAIRDVTSEYVLFLDDDTYLESSESLRAALEFLEDNAQFAGVVFRYVRTYDAATSFPPDTEPGPTVAISGGGLLIRAQSFRAVGGYRECLMFGAEDTELGWRLQAQGFQIWRDPSWIVFHDHVSVARDIGWEETNYGRSSVLMNALNIAWPWGIIRGLLVSLRRGLKSPRRLHYASGVISGIRDAWRLRSEVTPIDPLCWRRIRARGRHT